MPCTHVELAAKGQQQSLELMAKGGLTAAAQGSKAVLYVVVLAFQTTN